MHYSLKQEVGDLEMPSYGALKSIQHLTKLESHDFQWNFDLQWTGWWVDWKHHSSFETRTDL